MRYASLALFALVIVVIVLSSATGDREGQARHASVARLPRRPWTAIHNWVYWLDGPRLDQIGRSHFELAVIDYSADGTAAGAFSGAQIEALRQATCERRVLAYLSIGEAENYRWYWRRGWRAGVPAWIVGQDANWPGNFWVRYWDPAWQSIIYRYLDKIIAAGFDGIYLDRIDAYAEPYAQSHEQDMVAFVEAIARYARRRSPIGRDFGVIVQNAEDLAVGHPAYVATVDGIGREETYVRATNRPTPAAERADVETKLALFRRHSRSGLVLTVDYATRPDLIRLAYQEARLKGFIPYVADVALDRVQTSSGYMPECHPLSASPTTGG